MIGQTRLRNTIQRLIEEDKLPRFVILTGQRGSGKKVIANWIADTLDGQKYVLPDVKVDTIREMIETAYKQKSKTVIIISDADSMSVASKNAILKVTEEPPNNVYFVMTLEGLHNTLDTIKSRATTYTLDNYTRDELSTYTTQLHDVKDDEKELLLKTAINPGQINILHEACVKEFYDYVEKVVNNIAEVSGANCFKIADKVSLKADADGYDLELFFQIFMQICVERMIESEEDETRYADGITITSQMLADLRITGVNKQFLIDRWILEIRKAWM